MIMFLHLNLISYDCKSFIHKEEIKVLRSAMFGVALHYYLLSNDVRK